MKILLINYEYPPIGAGAATATQQIALAFRRLGHEPVVLTSQFGPLRGVIDEDGVRVVRVPSRRQRREASSIGEMISFIFAALPVVRGLVRRERVTGIIAFFSIPGGPLAWWATRGTPIPYLVSLRGGDVPGAEPRLRTMHALLAPIRRQVLRRAAAVVANSPGLGGMSEAADPIPVRVIPNGVDIAFFRPADRKHGSNGFSWLFVGRFQPQKNLPWLVREFAELIEIAPGPVTLDLVGDGPQRRELEALTRKLGIDQHLRWHGWLDRSKLSAIYQASDALANPSLYEGMPNVVLEAMASGLPVLASRVPGNDAVVSDGVTGGLFTLGDAAAFQRHALAWMRDVTLSRRLGQAGRARVEREFSWDQVAASYLELLTSSRPTPP